MAGKVLFVNKNHKEWGVTEIKFQIGDLVEAAIPLKGHVNDVWAGFDIPPGTVGIVERVEKNTGPNRNVPDMSMRLRVIWEYGTQTLYSDKIYEYMIRHKT